MLLVPAAVESDLRRARIEQVPLDGVNVGLAVGITIVGRRRHELPGGRCTDGRKLLLRRAGRRRWLGLRRQHSAGKDRRQYPMPKEPEHERFIHSLRMAHYSDPLGPEKRDIANDFLIAPDPGARAASGLGPDTLGLLAEGTVEPNAAIRRRYWNQPNSTALPIAW